MGFAYCFGFLGIVAVSNAFIAPRIGLSPEADSNLQNDKARVIGVGSEVQSGDLKYRLSLRPLISPSKSCGASLVEVENIQVAITSAQCPHLHKIAAFVAYYVSNDTRKPSDHLKLVGGNFQRGGNVENQQERQIVDFVTHEKFNLRKGALNDIAVLFIDKPFDLNKDVATIALPKQNQRITGRVILSGWGPPKTKIVQNEFVLEPFENLNKVEVPVLNYAACNSSTVSSTSFDELSDNLLCTGFKNKWTSLYKDDSCPIDSGGPIKSVEGNYLAGVIYSGNGCKSPDSPTANINVARYIDWITEEVRKYKAAGGSDEDVSKEETDNALRAALKKSILNTLS